MASVASGLRSGSMSLEFSGQITRSGCGARPARTRAARSRVPRAWLSRTARRSALNSSPGSGTLPWTAATCTLRPPAEGTRGTASPPSRTARSAAAQSTRAATGLPGARSGGRITATASSAPAAATAAETSGAPPIAASPRVGAWLCEKASRPHGNPPNGVAERAASCATHSPVIAATTPERPNGARQASGSSAAIAAR